MALGVPSLRDRDRTKYASCRDPLTALRQRMRELAQTRVRFWLRGFASYCGAKAGEVGKERFYRVYTEEGLALRRQRHCSSLKLLKIAKIERKERRPSGAWSAGQRKSSKRVHESIGLPQRRPGRDPGRPPLPAASSRRTHAHRQCRRSRALLRTVRRNIRYHRQRLVESATFRRPTHRPIGS